MTLYHFFPEKAATGKSFAGLSLTRNDDFPMLLSQKSKILSIKFLVMIIIYTNIIPLHKLAAINLFGILLAPKGSKMNRRTINHEAIHSAQMQEMLYALFYLWYFVEWMIRLFGKGNAYRSISLEKEAYHHDHDQNYLKNRKHFVWLKLL